MDLVLEAVDHSSTRLGESRAETEGGWKASERTPVQLLLLLLLLERGEEEEEEAPCLERLDEQRYPAQPKQTATSDQSTSRLVDVRGAQCKF